MHGGTDFELRTFDIYIYLKFQPIIDCPPKPFNATRREEERAAENKVWEHQCFPNQ